jgi:hypothetical protein
MKWRDWVELLDSVAGAEWSVAVMLLIIILLSSILVILARMLFDDAIVGGIVVGTFAAMMVETFRPFDDGR